MASTTPFTAPVRISRRVLDFLDGSSIFQEPHRDYSSDAALSAAARRLVAKLTAATSRKDGSVTIAVDLLEARVLYDYTSAMVAGARDNLGPYVDEDNSALAEVNSGRVPLPSAGAAVRRGGDRVSKVWEFNDGGRQDAGFKGRAGDCVTRAIAIADGRPYREVYDEIGARIGEWSKGRSRAAKQWRARKRGATGRNSTPNPVIKVYLAEQGWEWTPTMHIGSGTTVHLRADELPAGRVIARVSGHLCAVIDGVVQDTHDPTRQGTRAVYGYWVRS